MLSGYKGLTTLGLAALLLAGVGCAQDKPHEYGKERPPVGDVSRKDRGLQSKDVVASSDKMAMDMLALPELNASKDRWLVVVDHIDNMTADRRQDLDIFLERLRVNLAQQGRNRVQLVENRDKLRQLQARELDTPASGDQFGQGSGARPAAPSRYQPDYFLYGKIMEMANRRNSYFLCEFTLTDSHTGLQVWTNAYEVNAHQ